MADQVHHMTAKYGGLSGSFSEKLEQARDLALDRMTKVFQKVVIRVGTTIIMLSPVDTGRFRANWQLTVDAPASSSLDEFDQAGHETVARLVSDAQHLTFGQTAYLVNNLAYSIPLEYGHSQQAPTGMVRITVEQFQLLVEEAVREVTT